MTNKEFTHTNEPWITRGLEVFMVATKISRLVSLKVIGLPRTGSYYKMYKLVRNNKPNRLMQGIVEFQMSNLLKGPNVESVESCYERALNYRNSKNIFTEEKIIELTSAMGQVCKNLIKVAADKLSFQADTVSAVYMVAGAIAFMDGSLNEIRAEHIAEAVQYFSGLMDPVTKAYEMLEKVKGKSSNDTKNLKEIRRLLFSRISY